MVQPSGVCVCVCMYVYTHTYIYTYIKSKGSTLLDSGSAQRLLWALFLRDGGGRQLTCRRRRPQGMNEHMIVDQVINRLSVFTRRRETRVARL